MKVEVAFENGSVAEIADFENFMIGKANFDADEFASRTIPIDRKEICTFVGKKEIITSQADKIVYVKLSSL